VLEARVDRLEAALQRLAEALVQLTVRMDQFVARVDRLDARMAWVTGDALERRYRERAHSYFQGLLTRIEAVAGDDLSRMAFEAERRGTISRAEHEDVLRADVVARGRQRDSDAEAFLLAEVSVVIDKGDVERAARRAAILQRMVGLPVIPASAGEQILPDAEREAITTGVWRVLDGRAEAPSR
jgi:uncharacterized coiled-coil protein SlyX